MGIYITILEQGLIYGILALGVYITYKILDFPDLTVDGSFPLGAALTATMITRGVHPILTLPASFLIGVLAGVCTGLIHVKFKVCETYRSLQNQNGVNELLEEISQKITLLNEEQDRIDGERESRVSMIITVFGLVSIISATLQMLDYISTGRPLMIIGFLATSVVMILFFLIMIYKEVRKKKKRKDR